MRRYTTWEVWRPVVADDGYGGQTVTMTLIREERGDMRKLSGTERVEAQQAGADHTHTGYFRLRADIARNDELRRGTDVLRVETAYESFPAIRLRVEATSVVGGD